MHALRFFRVVPLQSTFMLAGLATLGLYGVVVLTIDATSGMDVAVPVLLLHMFAVAMAPAGFIAVLAGWITTETGRQPFTVYGLLRTVESASPLAAPAVASSLIAFIIVYFAVFTAGVIYLLRLMAAPPHPGEEGPSHEVPIRTAGITPAAGAVTEGAAR